MNDAKKLIPMLIIPSGACIFCSVISSSILATLEPYESGDTLGPMIGSLLMCATPIFSGLIGFGTIYFVVIRDETLFSQGQSDSRVLTFYFIIVALFFIISFAIVYIGVEYGSGRF